MTRFNQILHSDPDVLGGTLVFVGTRVKREQAIAALDFARDSLLARARPA